MSQETTCYIDFKIIERIRHLSEHFVSFVGGPRSEGSDLKDVVMKSRSSGDSESREPLHCLNVESAKTSIFPIGTQCSCQEWCSRQCSDQHPNARAAQTFRQSVKKSFGSQRQFLRSLLPHLSPPTPTFFFKLLG